MGAKTVNSQLNNYTDFENFVISTINKSLKCNLTKFDIDITHVFPNVKKGKRSIIIKFIRSIKNYIFGLKKYFKGSGMTITESLKGY